MQKWYNGSISYRKRLLLIMQRAQKPAELSAKGVIIISLDNFKNVGSIFQYYFEVKLLSQIYSIDDLYNVSLLCDCTQIFGKISDIIIIL